MKSFYLVPTAASVRGGTAASSISTAHWPVICASSAAIPCQAHADRRIPARLENFIALGSAALEDADRAVQHVAESGAGLAAIVHDDTSVKLHAPWPERRIACVGGNYAAHLAGMWAGRPGVTADLEQITRMAREEGQWGFWKTPAEGGRSPNLFLKIGDIVELVLAADRQARQPYYRGVKKTALSSWGIIPGSGYLVSGYGATCALHFILAASIAPAVGS